MKRLIFLLGFFIFAVALFAQESDTNATLTKKQKREAEAEKNFQLFKKLIDNKDFVLEANWLQDRYGNRIPVASSINFIAIDSTQAVIQIGSNYRVGPNGVGGVTAKGKITEWQLNENEKNKSFTLRINVMTPIGIYDLLVSINAYGQGRATLTGLRSGQLTFDGNLISNAESSVYEGRSL